jgi:hypothetical protein
MRIIDGLKLKGQPARIPDADRNDLPQFFLDMGFKVGAEIGVDKGEFTEEFCKAGLKMYAIDPWLYYGDYAHPRGQNRLDFLYSHTQRQLAKYDCEIIRKTSMDAAKDFEDNSIDFVYIDGHHGFKYVAEDIWEWSKKVKKGGVISGHDYALTRHREIRDPFVLHVKYVVQAYTKALGIKNWYVIGSDESKPGEKREMFRSWFWINP